MPGSPATPERRVATDRREDARRPRPGRRITDIASADGAHITVQAFAAYLGLAPRAIVEFIDAGTLTAEGRGSDVRIRTGDVFLQSRAAPTAS